MILKKFINIIVLKDKKMSAFEEIKKALEKVGYSEQQIIDLLTRFLEENSPENLDKTLVELLDSFEDDSKSNMH